MLGLIHVLFHDLGNNLNPIFSYITTCICHDFSDFLHEYCGRQLVSMCKFKRL